MSTLAYPTLAEIQERPELPALTMLYNALDTAREAILMAHPDTHFLHIEDAPACHDAQDDARDACWAAHMLAIMASELQIEVENYCWPERAEENENRYPKGFDPEAPF